MDVLSPLLRVENFPYVEHIFGIVLGSGLSSAQRDTNSSLLDSALAANGGTIYRAKRGTTLEIGKRIVVPSNAGIIGDTGKGAKFRIYCAVAKFTNTDNTTSTNLGITVGRYGPQSVAIDFSGVSYTTGAAATRTTGVRLQNFQIEFEVSSNRILRGIVGRNTEKFLIDDVEIKGLPNGIGICLASAINGKINEPHIHTSAIVGTDSTYSQLTGIEFDNDILNGYSSDIDVVHPKIHDLTASGGTVNSVGWQTDGIQIVNANTLRIKVIGGSIRNVGEGIDWYGSFGSVTGTTIENCQTKNLKLIHGASYNTFSGLTLNRGGIANLSLEGSSAANLDVRGNVFTGIVCKSVNHLGHFTANETACVLIGSGTSKNYDNIFSNCFLDGDGTAKHGWADFSSGNGNIGDGIKITNVITNRINITAGGGSVREVGSAAFVTSKSAAALVLSPITVPDDAYGAGWDGSIEVPTKNAIYDKIQTLGGGVSLAAANTWTATQTYRVDSTGGHYIVVQNRDVSGTQSAGIALVQGGVDFATGRHAEITASGGSTPTINFRTSFGDPPADRFHISAAGNFYPAPGAATNMTNGFVYISAADGPPTGVPANYAGVSPLYMDRTNNNLYCYANSAWRNVTGTGGGGGVTSVGGTAPIVSSGGTTPAISITPATTSAAGSMSAADKTKLDGVATGATATGDWTILKLASDYTISTIAAGDIPGLTFTPDASSVYEFEFYLDCYTSATATGPQPVVNWGANISHGSTKMYSPATLTSETTANAPMTASGGTCRSGCLGLPVANVAYGFTGHGRVNTNAATAVAIKLQLGAETAALVGVKNGSFLKYRKI